MAVNQDSRLKVQVVYESNNWSPKEVKENRFADDEEIKIKTIESWVTKFGWKKNRFASEMEAIDNVIEGTLPIDEVKKIVKDKMKSDVVDCEVVGDENDDEDDKYSGMMAIELSYKVLNVHALQFEMANNLEKTKKLADKSNSIGVKKTYHDMLINTYQTIHGKNINITPKNPDDNSLSTEDIKKKSDEELDRLIKG
ncbi:MAG: hypothetical protein PHV52_00170 [Aliarcobacter sp.]|nr:hypothetical protein [Aliarcobacter sp.]